MKLNIGVLFGGNSVEHEVSVISASQAIAAIDKERYHVIPLYLTKDHRLFSGEALFDVKNFKKTSNLLKQCKQVSIVKIQQRFYIQPVKSSLFTKAQEVDVILPVVHGTHCEDGSIQGYLETIGIPYSGSDVISAALGQDKVFMKMAFEHHNIPMVPWFYFNQNEYRLNKDKVITDILSKVGLPCVVKPARLGSSVGITLVKTLETLNESIIDALNYDTKIVIEKAVIDLREVNCSVLGDEVSVEASVLEEVMKYDAILSYKDKYQSNSKSKGMASTSRICPAELDEALTKKVQDLAKEVFVVLGCSGVTRIDFLMDSNTMELYVNEINTIPGSLSFYLWDKSGYNFTDLMDRLIDQSIQRQRRREKMVFSFDTNLLDQYSNNGSKGSKA
ncbi:MAG TPA: D-alanine--D-alanine ligase family protein [Erysipelotrichaceae bacterium]|nr:D-alanine--D-alanine ligase family protein [Erysipelotrichaceae bacterium]